MANTGINNNWDKIQLGVKDVERLIGQKDYNTAMIKARQTLEFMVKLLIDRACIVDSGDLKEMIDALYQNRWISKSTCEHYHKIRMIGNKAVHEGDSNAYNANQAYHVLSQEVYTFANDYRNAQRGTKPRAAASSQKRSGGTSSNRGTSSGRGTSQSRPSSSQTNRSRKRTTQKQSGFTLYDLLKIMIPVLCVILLICVIKLVKPSSKKDNDPSAPVTTEASTEAPTEAPETAAPSIVYKTTSVLNVRPQPNTDTDRIGQLQAGTVVEYLGAYDDTWAMIRYNGQQAYVASQYLTTE